MSNNRLESLREKWSDFRYGISLSWKESSKDFHPLKKDQVTMLPGAVYDLPAAKQPYPPKELPRIDAKLELGGSIYPLLIPMLVGRRSKT